MTVSGFDKQSDVTSPVAEFFDRAYSGVPRYWLNREPEVPIDLASAGLHASLFREIQRRRIRHDRALEVGCGEGADAIHLANAGFEVDAIDASAVAVEKAEVRARTTLRSGGVSWRHEDACSFVASNTYDVILASGVLHYVLDKERFLARLCSFLNPGGLLAVSVFSDMSAVPHCHRIIPVLPDMEGGVLEQTLTGWSALYQRYERNKIDFSHPGFPTHAHSYIKLIVARPY